MTRLEDALAAVRILRSALLEVEWTTCADEGTSCPWCGGTPSYYPYPAKPNGGHAEDCERLAALRLADEVAL